MANPTLILGANNWAIEEDNILGYALGSSSNQYLPREISFTRGSDATYTDSTGVIRPACWNLLSYSEDFSNALWLRNNSTIISNAVTAPDGTLTADKLVETTANGSHNVFFVLSPKIITYTASFYAKAAERNFAYYSFGGPSWGGQGFMVNLTTGEVTQNTTGTTPVVTLLSDGWVKVEASRASVSTAQIQFQVFTGLDATTFVFTGDSTKGIYIWGAQLVEGSEPLAYLRTTDRLNIPRVDSSTGSKAFLLEPQRTNLALWSDDFSNAIYSKYQATVTTNATTSPDGTTNADKIIATAVAAEHYALQNINTNSGTSYTYSVYLKASEYTWAKIATNTPGSAVGAFFNLSTGVVGTIDAGVTASIQSVGNGWYRCVVTTTSNSTALKYFVVWPTINGSSIVYTGDGTSGIFSYGFQVEQGTYPTTYMPTQASTVTRLADSAVKTGISSLIGQSEGTVFMDVYFTQASSAGFRAFFCLEGSVSSQFSGFVVATTNNGNNVNYAGTIYDLTTGRHKIACTYSQANNQRKLFVDGVLRSTSTHTNFLATIDRVSVGCRINPFSGFATDRELSSGILHFATYPELVSDSELVTLTTL